MVTYSEKGLRLLVLVCSVSAIIGAIAIVGVGVYLTVMAIQGEYAIPLVLAEGLQIPHVVRAKSLASYLVYDLGLVITLSLGLSFVFLLRAMLRSLYRTKGFERSLPTMINRMGVILILLSYMRQFLLLHAFNQDMGSLGGVIDFRFQLVPSAVIHALVLFVVARAFRYALDLQHEYEQTV